MIHFGKDANVAKSIELYVFSNLKFLINEDKASHFIEFLLDNEYYALVLFNYLVGNNSYNNITDIASGKYSNHILRKLF